MKGIRLAPSRPAHAQLPVCTPRETGRTGRVLIPKASRTKRTPESTHAESVSQLPPPPLLAREVSPVAVAAPVPTACVGSLKQSPYRVIACLMTSTLRAEKRSAPYAPLAAMIHPVRDSFSHGISPSWLAPRVCVPSRKQRTRKCEQRAHRASSAVRDAWIAAEEQGAESLSHALRARCRAARCGARASRSGTRGSRAEARELHSPGAALVTRSG